MTTFIKCTRKRLQIQHYSDQLFFITYAKFRCCKIDKSDVLLQPWVRRNRCCNRKNQNKVERLSVYAISLSLHGS